MRLTDSVLNSVRRAAGASALCIAACNPTPAPVVQSEPTSALPAHTQLAQTLPVAVVQPAAPIATPPQQGITTVAQPNLPETPPAPEVVATPTVPVTPSASPTRRQRVVRPHPNQNHMNRMAACGRG